MLNEVLKNSRKMISPDIKTDVKQEIKELVAVSFFFFNLKFLFFIHQNNITQYNTATLNR